MTAAICVECGAWKFGAWTPCVRCRRDPATAAGLLALIGWI